MLIYRIIMLMGLAVSVFDLANSALQPCNQIGAQQAEILDLTQESGSESDTDSESDCSEEQLIRAVGRNDFQNVQWFLSRDLSFSLDTAFYEALKLGHRELVKLFIKKGVDLNTIPGTCLRSDTVPLIVAFQNGHVALMRDLVEAGADVNLWPSFLYAGPILYHAVDTGNLDIVSYLIAHGAKVRGRNWKGYSPLNVAAGQGNLQMLRFLVEKGIKTKQRKSYYTAVHAAARGGHVDALEYILNLNPELAAQACNTYTPLYYAVAGGHFACVRLLVGIYHVSLDESVGSARYTPLMRAAINGHAEVVRYLILAGAQLDKKTRQGETALDCARRLNKHDIVELLSNPKGVREEGSQGVPVKPGVQSNDSGEGQEQDASCVQGTDLMQSDQDLGRQDAEPYVEATPQGLDDDLCAGSRSAQVPEQEQHQNSLEKSVWNTLMQKIAEGDTVGFVVLLQQHTSLARKSDQHGYTLLQHAARHGNATIFFALLGARASIDQKDSTGYTTLHYAALGGHKGIVKHLIQKNQALSAEAKDGKTPFLFAVEQGHQDIVSLFLENINDEQKMAVLNRPNKYGILPLQEAAKRGRHAVGRVLIENGAFVSSYDVGCSTPLHYAVTGGHIEMVRLLLGAGGCRQVQDKDHRIPLDIAQAKGYRRIVNLLRQSDRDVAEPKSKRQRVCKEIETTISK